jgi:hypothetical protein
MTSPISSATAVPSYLLTPTGMANIQTESADPAAVPSADSTITFTAAEQVQNAETEQDGVLLSGLSAAAGGADPWYGQDVVTLSAADYTAATDYQIYSSSGATTALAQWLTTGSSPAPTTTPSG